MKEHHSSGILPQRILFIEPSSGISGDMFLGALLDLGIDRARLEEKLGQLHLHGYRISVSHCMRAGIKAVKFDVHEEQDHGADSEEHEHHGHGHGDHQHRSFRDIRALIEASWLSEWVKKTSIEAFRRLAEAEGKIHDRPADEVHFHEVGAVDSIIDIVGTVAAVEELLPVRVISTRINVGQGTLKCQHGVYPAPGPATLELLRRIPIYSAGDTGELTTPTGAALLIALADSFGPRPPMTLDRIGYGAGSKDLRGAANVLRVTLGQALPAEHSHPEAEQVAIIEANVDDMNPQLYGYFQERALAAGALDVFAIPAQMKKNRPGMMITVICEPGQIDALAQLIFAETTTIGIRYWMAGRKILDREFTEVPTEFGNVIMKVGSAAHQRLNFAPEYESCRRLAEETGAPLKEIMAAAVRAYLKPDRTK